MPAIKAREVRLIDILHTINENESIILHAVVNGKRWSYPDTVGSLEIRFSKELSSPIQGISCPNGVINIYI